MRQKKNWRRSKYLFAFKFENGKTPYHCTFRWQLAQTSFPSELPFRYTIQKKIALGNIDVLAKQDFSFSRIWVESHTYPRAVFVFAKGVPR